MKKSEKRDVKCIVFFLYYYVENRGYVVVCYIFCYIFMEVVSVCLSSNYYKVGCGWMVGMGGGVVVIGFWLGLFGCFRFLFFFL